MLPRSQHMIDRHGALEDGWQALCGCAEEGGGGKSRPQSRPPPSNREASRDAVGKTRRLALSPVLEKQEAGVTHDTRESLEKQASRMPHDTRESPDSIDTPLQAIREVGACFIEA